MGLKKILIISYFFPPSNFAGSYRIESFVKYLPEYGWKPVVITRGWEEGQTATYFPSPNREKMVESNDERTIIRLPFKGNLRDRIYAQYKNNTFLNLFARLLSFIEVTFQNFIPGIYPYGSLYRQAIQVLNENPEIKMVLISGRPFQLFKIGYLLKKRFPEIKWIADYRDEWSTHQWIVDQSLKDKFIGLIDYRFEKKWLKSATSFITCSENWKHNIKNFTGVNGHVVLNGYEENVRDFFKRMRSGSREKFTIVHNGTLYGSQPVSEFLNAYKNFIDSGNKKDVMLLFPGVMSEPAQAKRIVSNLKGYEQYYRIMERIHKQDVIEMQGSASVLLMFGTKKEIKGHYSSKIFEYLASGKPILLFPTDQDVIEELLLKTGAGQVFSDEQEVLRFLESEYQKYKKNPQIQFIENESISFYSRKSQARILSEVLNSEKSNQQPITESPTFRNNLFRTADALQFDKVLLSIRHKHTLIICLHRVSDERDEANPPMNIRTFTKFVDLILEKYTPCSLNDLETTPNKNRVLFTYDDGYKDWIENVMPVHLKKGIPAALFVVTDSVRGGKPIWTQLLSEAVKSRFRKGKPVKIEIADTPRIYNPAKNNIEDTFLEIFEFLLKIPIKDKMVILSKIGDEFESNCPAMLNESDVCHIANCGFEIGSHSCSHENYQILASDSIRNDLLSSKEYIENLTKKPCTSFAFPNGLFTSESVDLAHQAGFKFVFATQDNVIKNGTIDQLLPRVLIYHHDPVESYYKALLLHSRLKRIYAG